MCDMHLVILSGQEMQNRISHIDQPTDIGRDVRYVSCDFSGQNTQNTAVGNSSSFCRQPSSEQKIARFHAHL